MKVLITGNKGFVGKATEAYFKDKGHEVVGFDLSNKQDITDWESFSEFLDDHKPDVVLHEAAIAQFSEADKNPRLAYEVNVQGTDNVSQSCNYYDIPLVYASTGSVYMPVTEIPITEESPVRGNSVYGCSKATAEQYVVESGARYMLLRYAHLYGKEKIGHGLIGGYLAKIQQGEQPQLMGGDQTNDFTYIDDICEANLFACEAILDENMEKSWNQAYNIGTGTELTAKDAGDYICSAVGWKGGVKIMPVREADPKRFAYNVDKAEKLLGFKAKVDFKEGMEKMLG